MFDKLRGLFPNIKQTSYLDYHCNESFFIESNK